MAYVELPHDWSIEDLSNQSDSIISPFTTKSVGATSTGYVVGGTAWYRKHFTLNNIANKKATIYFDGVYMNSDVWINEHHLDNHPYGYTPFYYDLTPYLKQNGENILAVRVRNEGKNSRWYSGSGIYCHVWLTITNPLHIEQWGVYITTRKVSEADATINIETNLTGTQNLNLSPSEKGMLDEKRQLVPNDALTLRFSISGNGEIFATGNANPSGMESFQKPEHKTFSRKMFDNCASKRQGWNDKVKGGR